MDDDNRRGAERRRLFEVHEVSRPDETVTAEVKDLSMTGLRIAVERPIDVSAVVLVHAHYNPLGFPLRTLVRWCRPSDDGRFEAGLEFLNLDADERELLADHLSALEAARYEAPEQG